MTDWNDIFAGPPEPVRKSKKRKGVPDFETMTDEQITETLRSHQVTPGAILTEPNGRQRLVLFTGRTIKPESKKPDRDAAYYVVNLIADTKTVTRVIPENAWPMKVTPATSESAAAAKTWRDWHRDKYGEVLD